MAEIEATVSERRQRISGIWLIPINGAVVEGNLVDITFDGTAHTATLKAPNKPMPG